MPTYHYHSDKYSVTQHRGYADIVFKSVANDIYFVVKDREDLYENHKFVDSRTVCAELNDEGKRVIVVQGEFTREKLLTANFDISKIAGIEPVGWLNTEPILTKKLLFGVIEE